MLRKSNLPTIVMNESLGYLCLLIFHFFVLLVEFLFHTFELLPERLVLHVCLVQSGLGLVSILCALVQSVMHKALQIFEGLPQDVLIIFRFDCYLKEIWNK